MLSLITRKPATVTAVFDKAVADVRVIEKAQEEKQKTLRAEQEANVKALDAEIAALEAKRKAAQDTFKGKSTANAEAIAAAEKERMLAGKVIKKFADLFGVSAKATDAA